MKWLVDKLINTKKYVMFLTLIIFSLFIIGCNNEIKKFNFMQNSITKEIGATFNVFDLDYTTTLPKEIENNLKTNNGVEIEAQNSAIVSINNSEITPKIKGSTIINVKINYNNEKITSHFTLIIIEKNTQNSEKEIQQKPNNDNEINPDSGDETPNNNNEFCNKDGIVFGELKDFKYTYTFEINEDNTVTYSLTLYKNNEALPYIDYAININNEIIKQNKWHREINLDNRNNTKIVLLDCKNNNKEIGTIILRCNWKFK